MSLQNISKIQSENKPELIRVSTVDVSDYDIFKLKKIFLLSSNRTRQYEWTEEHADVVISTNPEYKSVHAQILTLGNPSLFPDSKYHIKPPLIGIRLLKALDAIPVDQGEQTQSHVLDTDGKLDSNQQAQNRYKVLVVDDSVLIHKALQLELEKAEFGTDIDYAETGERCLELISERPYDMIFLDVMMPGIDGYETCTELRKNPNFKKTPVIMLSAKTSPLDEVKGVMAGCTTYLTKPIKHDDFQKLLVRMDKWLENFNPS